MLTYALRQLQAFQAFGTVSILEVVKGPTPVERYKLQWLTSGYRYMCLRAYDSIQTTGNGLTFCLVRQIAPRCFTNTQ